MRVKKNSLQISILFLALMGIALAPPALARLKEKAKIGQIYKQKIKAEGFQVQKNIGIADKLRIIISVQLEEAGLIRQEKLSDDDEEIAVWTEKVMEQMSLLKTLHVVPELHYNQDFTVNSGSKITFAEIKNYHNAVSVIQLSFVYESFTLFVWIEEDSEKIIQFSIASEQELVNEKNKSIPLNYFEYLGLDTEQLNYSSEKEEKYWFSVEEDTDVVYRYRNKWDNVEMKLGF